MSDPYPVEPYRAPKLLKRGDAIPDLTVGRNYKLPHDMRRKFTHGMSRREWGGFWYYTIIMGVIALLCVGSFVIWCLKLAGVVRP